MNFKSLQNIHQGRDFLVCCPGKNIKEWMVRVKTFALQNDLVTIGSNRINDLIHLDYHMFTNNDKYEAYGHRVKPKSTLLLGSHILKKHIKMHKPKKYISVQYTDRDVKEQMCYDAQKDIIYGYYRTSGNLAIMICFLMGAKRVYVAGMSGFAYKFDGDVHYYKAEIKRDKKSKKEWTHKYDKPVMRSLDNIKKHGVDFTLITPTIYKKHYDGSILKG